ncbi:hypothetical protein C7M84_016641 [Penaeus vannamei]|uniref:Uncharacterized protein n=1 Tax=Penaeus vannamei TaxID=6689 RepID=A0A423SMB9_PENVA|nr:hypothetical protein C7M84_016641 [Penaeus vannamei]
MCQAVLPLPLFHRLLLSSASFPLLLLFPLVYDCSAPFLYFRCCQAPIPLALRVLSVRASFPLLSFVVTASFLSSPAVIGLHILSPLLRPGFLSSPLLSDLSGFLFHLSFSLCCQRASLYPLLIRLSCQLRFLSILSCMLVSGAVLPTPHSVLLNKAASFLILSLASLPLSPPVAVKAPSFLSCCSSGFLFKPLLYLLLQASSSHTPAYADKLIPSPSLPVALVQGFPSSSSPVSVPGLPSSSPLPCCQASFPLTSLLLLSGLPFPLSPVAVRLPFSPLSVAVSGLPSSLSVAVRASFPLLSCACQGFFLFSSPVACQASFPLLFLLLSGFLPLLSCCFLSSVVAVFLSFSLLLRASFLLSCCCQGFLSSPLCCCQALPFLSSPVAGFPFPLLPVAQAASFSSPLTCLLKGFLSSPLLLSCRGPFSCKGAFQLHSRVSFPLLLLSGFLLSLLSVGFFLSFTCCAVRLPFLSSPVASVAVRASFPLLSCCFHVAAVAPFPFLSSCFAVLSALPFSA